MQTVLQELIEWLEITEQENIKHGSSANVLNEILLVKNKVIQLLPKEKSDLMDAYIVGSLDDTKDPKENAEEYYNQIK